MLFDDRASGLLVAGLGVVVVGLARSFPMMPGQSIGPSLFPTIVGVLLVLVGVTLALRAPRGGGVGIGLDTAMRRPRMAVNFALVVFSLLAYALLVDRMGFFLTAALLLAVLFRAFSVPPGRALGLAAVLPFAIHYVFYTLLRVPLPWGLLQSIAW